MNDEYQSNPRLAVLAEELRVLNEQLIEQGLPSHIRINRLRAFSENTKNIVDPNYAKGVSIHRGSESGSRFSKFDDEGIKLPSGVHKTTGGRFTASRVINGHTTYLGTFDTVEAASSAFIAADPKNQAQPHTLQ